MPFKISSLTPEELQKEDSSRLVLTDEMAVDLRNAGNKTVVVPHRFIDKNTQMFRYHKSFMRLALQHRKDSINYILCSKEPANDMAWWMIYLLLHELEYKPIENIKAETR